MDYFHHGRERHFILIGIYLLWIKTSFLHAMLVQKLIQKPSVDLINLSHFHGLPHSIPFDQEFLSEQNCGNEPMLMEFTGIITDLSATIAWWKGLLNTQLQCLVPIQQGWGGILQKAICSESVSNIALLVFFFSFFQSQDSGIQESTGRNGSSTTHYYQ